MRIAKSFTLTGWWPHLIAILVVASSAVGIASGRELARWGFESGPEGWSATHCATVSEVTRRPGVRSLMIEQSEDDEADSAWSSPILESSGKPLRVRFWAADNYVVQPDYSYSAAVGLAACDAEGNALPPQSWVQIPWDEGRREPWWGRLTSGGLVWKRYEATLSPPAGPFRVVFFWPRTLVRGVCYLAEVSVWEVSADAQPADPLPEQHFDSVPKFTLEITTSASGNLFYADDPLRFECLFFDPSGKPLAPLIKPMLAYEITDYEGGRIAAGELPFDPAVTQTPARQTAKVNRSHNLWQSMVLDIPAARAVGRLFYLHVVLRDGEQRLAEDTVPYGVIDPRRIDPASYDECQFIFFEGNTPLPANTESKHEDQSIRAKMGVTFIHDWDYHGWRRAQPKFPGPMTVQPLPDFPKVIYCPNLEQIRGRKPGHPYGDISSMAPEGASFDDPLRPGCKTFDIDGYVAYIVARVRAQRKAITMVVASGLERTIDEKTIELQRKVYAALKREFPDLPVGMMLYGLFLNPSKQADVFLREKLYEYADFLNDHMYSPSMDYTEWERVRDTAKAAGKELFFISTEFSRVGGTDQLERSRAMVTSHVEAWARGLRMITYFNITAATSQPILRGEVPGGGFQWMQRVDRPLVSEPIGGPKRPNQALMPLLQTLTYHNFVRNFEGAEYRATFKPGKDSVAYVFSRAGQTICAFYLTRPVAPETLAITGDVPLTVQDLFGRTERLEPSQMALVSATLDPAVLVFDHEVPALYDSAEAAKMMRTVPGGVTAGEVPVETPAQVQVSLPEVFTQPFTAQISGTVDGTWPRSEPQTVQVLKQTAGEVALPVWLDPATPVGTYTFRVHLHDGQRLIGALQAPLTVADLLTMRIDGSPVTADHDPAISVTLRNLGSKPMAGSLSLLTDHFGDGMTPADFMQRYAVAPHGEAVLRFDIPRWQVNMTASYPIEAIAREDAGLTHAAREEVSFRASVKTESPITVDGDLSDWDLKKLVPIPFERYHTAWGKPIRDAADLDAVMYSRWDAQNLYFAVVVSDDQAVARFNTVDMWQDDNIMLGLYPWGWRLGETFNAGYYREHLGLCLDGTSRVFRVGNVPSGPSSAAGVQLAVRKTSDGYVYEWAYPHESITPLPLEAGSRFRLSLAVIDRDGSEKEGWSPLGAIQLGGFNLGIDAQPAKWREFLLIDPGVRSDSVMSPIQ